MRSALRRFRKPSLCHGFPLFGRLLSSCLAIALLSIGQSSGGETVKWQLTEVAKQAGVDFTLISGTAEKKFLVETMGGGICVLDFDGDDWPDLFFVNGTLREHWLKGTGPSDRLFRNKGDGSFEDATGPAGLQDSAWGMGCAAADYDNDGDTDLYVANFGSNALYRNDGNGKFTNIISSSGADDPSWSTGAAFGDYDADGDLDLYVANYIEFDFEKPAGDPRFCSYRGVTVACGPRGIAAARDSLYRNEGGGRFSDVSETSGIRKAESAYGFQPMWTDMDLDGDVDVFVANDSTPNFLWENQGDGTFQENALLLGLAYNQEGRAQANMGVDIIDYDLNGYLDLYSTNFSDDYHVLYKNSGRSFFQDVTFASRIAQVTFKFLGFGSVFVDMDNDGLPDIFAANGHIYPEVEKFGLGSDYKQANQLFHNLGNGEFAAVTEAGSGLASIKSSRGISFLDWDRDGDLDLVVSNMDDEADLLRNDTEPRGNYIQIVLRGSKSNRDGAGARVILEANSSRQLQELHLGASFLGNNQKMLHFGLGSATRADRIVVHWPSGVQTELTSQPANRRLLIDEAQGLMP